MSLLLSAGINARAVISNGHMWVCALYGNEWQIAEVSRDPDYTAEVYIFKEHLSRKVIF
jgi:hypothetical protein